MKSKTELLTLTLNGKEETLTLVRKSVKNINLRIQRTGEIFISAPFSTPFRRIEDFVHAQEGFIARARKKLSLERERTPAPLQIKNGATVPLGGVPHTLFFEKGSKWCAKHEDNCLFITLKSPDDGKARKEAFFRFLKEESGRILTAMTAGALPLFSPSPKEMPALRFRPMTSKWGICRPTRKEITFNCYLALFPFSLSQYVVYHELAHFKHPNHSAAFWQHLFTLMPDAKERKNALNALSIPHFE